MPFCTKKMAIPFATSGQLAGGKANHASQARRQRATSNHVGVTAMHAKARVQLAHLSVSRGGASLPPRAEDSRVGRWSREATNAYMHTCIHA